MRGSPLSERQELSSADVGRIQHALTDLLGSRPFRSTQQCSSLLRYIVEHTLSGEESLLRERVIGAEIFGRSPGYETNEDPVVRLRVAEVRKRLAQYYSAEPDMADVRIEVPSGSYRAVFQLRAVEPGAHNATVEPVVYDEPVPLVPLSLGPLHHEEEANEGRRNHATMTPTRKHLFAALLSLAALVLLVSGVYVARQETPARRCFRRFWAPWTGSSTPVILAIGSNAVYRLRSDYVDHYAEQHGLGAQGLEVYVPFGKDNPVTENDLIPAYNTYLIWGDVAAVSDISAHLAKQHQAFQDRFPNDISFAEVRNTPSILIGGFNNPMTISLNRQLKFIMLSGDQIIDTGNPNQKWTLHDLDTADYAILTRLVRRDGDAPLLSAAGLGQYGTLATARLFCDPAELYRIARQLPDDWTSKNLQAVLRISIVNFKPTITDVVAYRTW